MMIAKEQFPLKLFTKLFRGAFVFLAACLCQLGANQVRHPEFLFHPERHGFEKRTKSGGSIIEVSFKETVEFQQRLVIKAYVVQVCGVQFSFAETVASRVYGKTMIMLYASEP